MRSGMRWWGVLFWGVLAWSTAALGEEPSGPGDIQGYTVPGRNPDSATPWEFFLGHAAHRLIAYMYGVNHPDNTVYYNTEPIRTIITDTGLGDPSVLRPDERNLRPDIADITELLLFEIKPRNAQGLQDGLRDVELYLNALNRAMTHGGAFSRGMNFQGETLIRFAQGQYIWRLEWWTTQPGLIQYRWTRSQQRFESEAAAYEAGEWVNLTEQELRQYGGWVGQAVEGLVARREQLSTIRGSVGVVVDTMGTVATLFFSSVVLDRMGPRTGSQQPPSQTGGQLIPLPIRPSSLPRPVRIPAAASQTFH